jgi:hypothetical protein
MDFIVDLKGFMGERPARVPVSGPCARRVITGEAELGLLSYPKKWADPGDHLARGHSPSVQLGPKPTFLSGIEPVMWHAFVGRAAGLDADRFERTLYVIRKRFEREIEDSRLDDHKFYYFANLSCRTLVYNEMLTTEQLGLYFADDLGDLLLDIALCILHSRFSTNTYQAMEARQGVKLIEGGDDWEVHHLEARLRVKPIDRSTRSPALTPRGTYYEGRGGRGPGTVRAATQWRQLLQRDQAGDQPPAGRDPRGAGHLGLHRRWREGKSAGAEAREEETRCSSSR